MAKVKVSGHTHTHTLTHTHADRDPPGTKTTLYMPHDLRSGGIKMSCTTINQVVDDSKVSKQLVNS